jgi:hypothetical protein
MGDDFRRMECCQEECQEKCVKDCYCKDNGGNLIWLIILIVIIYCLFCNDDRNGGLFGNLF